MSKRIAILTGGGDVPGLNIAIKTVVHRAAESGYQVLGFRRGWWGPLHYDPAGGELNAECVLELDEPAVRKVDRTGGTFLHSSRTRPSHLKPKEVPAFLRGSQYDQPAGEFHDLTGHILRVLEHLGVDVLVAIGGDDTLSYANRLHREGMQVVAIPKTMDNDVPGTDYCIGFYTAVNRSVNFINDLRSTSGSHERISVVELYGRNSGETSLVAAYLSGADRAVISEVPFDPAHLAELLAEDKRNNPSRYAMMTISEGAQMIGGGTLEDGEADAYGHRKLGGIGEMLADQLQRITGQNVLYQKLAYLMRCGAPDALDLMVGANFGHLAMDLIEKRQSGRMVAIQKGVYRDVSLDIMAQGARKVDVEALYDRENYRPRMRDVTNMPMFLY